MNSIPQGKWQDLVAANEAKIPLEFKQVRLAGDWNQVRGALIEAERKQMADDAPEFGTSILTALLNIFESTVQGKIADYEVDIEDDGDAEEMMRHLEEMRKILISYYVDYSSLSVELNRHTDEPQMLRTSLFDFSSLLLPAQKDAVEKFFKVFLSAPPPPPGHHFEFFGHTLHPSRRCHDCRSDRLRLNDCKQTGAFDKKWFFPHSAAHSQNAPAFWADLITCDTHSSQFYAPPSGFSDAHRIEVNFYLDCDNRVYCVATNDCDCTDASGESPHDIDAYLRQLERFFM